MGKRGQSVKSEEMGVVEGSRVRTELDGKGERKGPTEARGEGQDALEASSRWEYGLRRVREREPLWTVQDIARYLQVSTKTVRRMEGRGLFSRCASIGGLVRFRSSDVTRLASAKGKEN